MIRVYLHVAGMHHYREIVAELAGMIDASGLYDAAGSLSVVTVGQVDLSHLLGEKWTVANGSDSLDAWEFPTLRAIHQHAIERPEDKYLYLHTKGVSRADPRGRAARDSWRRYMAWHVIRNWKTCVELLHQYDTVGTEIRRPPKHSPMHYAGNFWWARGYWLRSLPSPEPHFVWKGERYAAETWLLGSRPNSLAYSFREFDFPFWKRSIPEGFYRVPQVTNGICLPDEERISGTVPQSARS
jgi:hypothetical protein